MTRSAFVGAAGTSFTLYEEGMKRIAAKSTRKSRLTDEQFLAVSRAVSDPRRFAILQQVAAVPDGIGCSALQEHNVISPATISHHVKELSEAGLIQMERDGRCANLSLDRTVWKAYLQRLSDL